MQPTITRSAPPTAALATPPPDEFPTGTSPAMMLETAVVVLGIKTSWASKPFFLKKPASWAVYQTALLASTELYSSLIRSCAAAGAIVNPRIRAAIFQAIRGLLFIVPPII